MKKSTQNKYTKMHSKWTASEKLVRIAVVLLRHIPCSAVAIASIQETDAEELTLKLDLLKKEEKERGKKIKYLEAEIVKVKGEIDNPVKLEKMEVLIEEMVCVIASWFEFSSDDFEK